VLGKAAFAGNSQTRKLKKKTTMTRPGQFVRARILLVPLALAVVGCSLLLLGCSRLKQKTPFQQGSSAYDNGDYDKALADFNQAIQLDPKVAVAYNIRGAVYFHKGAYDRAFADFNQAIQLDPTYVFAYNNRGNVYLHKGDYDKAIADYDKAIQLDPKYAGAYDNRVKAYKVKGEKGARHLLDNGSLQP
jgi:tetratricopeptide (TPR) repeat protein